MYTVTFKGFERLEQAKAFADWYAGSGEQDSAAWLEECTDMQFANAEKITTTDEGVEVDLKLFKK